MNARLQQHFDFLEGQRKDILSSVSTLSTQQFVRRPAAHKWSVGEILAHVQTSEQLSTQYIIKKMQGIDGFRNTNLKHDLLMIVLILSQRLPFKFKAPAVVASNTPSYKSLDEFTREWEKTRVLLRATLEKISDGQLKKQVYRHPIAGLINIEQALIFFREHLLHHQPQIGRALKAISA